MSVTEPGGHAIETMQVEERRFPPSPEFAARANAKADIYDRDFDDFWTEEAKRVTWFEPFKGLYEWKPPFAKFYMGGKLNVAYNCVDRHVEAGLGDRVAYHWEGEPVGETRTITFADLQREVVLTANGLRKLGVGKGTPVGIYMGMVPELPIAMLACARLGAPFTVVFGGFSGAALSDRFNDFSCELVITQDNGWRRGKEIALKANVDEALRSAPTVKTCVVYKRLGGDVAMAEGRDLWWDDATAGMPDDAASCPCEPSEEGSPEMLKELRDHVGRTIGKFAAPSNIVFTPELPKTRSGKIMRRLLRDVAENRVLGDTTTLADPTVVDEIGRRAKTEAGKEE